MSLQREFPTWWFIISLWLIRLYTQTDNKKLKHPQQQLTYQSNRNQKTGQKCWWCNYLPIVLSPLLDASMAVALSPGSLLKNGGRREPGNICKKSCRLLAHHLSGLVPLSHIRKLFFTNLRGVVHAYKFIFELTIFCWVEKMSRVHVVSFCNLIGTARPRRWKSTTFPPGVNRLSPPPFVRREPGNEATMAVYRYICTIYVSVPCRNWRLLHHVF